MQPETPQHPTIKMRHLPQQRHFLAAFFISLVWGLVGADRMYLGKWVTGILKLATIGGFGIWLVIDLANIMRGSTRDAWGRELEGYAEYKGLTSKVVSIYTAVLLIGLTLIILAAVYVVSQYLGGNMSVPGLDFLQGTSLTPEQRLEFGL